MTRKHTIDETYFNQINTAEKSYWLGFLYADGYVRHKSRSGHLKLKLKQSDIDHLILFKNHIQSSSPIKQYCEVVKGYQCHCCELNIYSLKLVNTLMAQGCVNNKSLILKFPTTINDELLSHFIRGYFDGDGTIYQTKNRPNSFSVRIAGTKDILNGIASYLKISPHHIYQQNNIYLLNYNRINSIKIIKEIFYSNSSLFLNRKKIIFDKIK